MYEFTEQAYKVFELFDKQWALVTAGTPEQFNSYTVAWGSLGSIWSRHIVTVYVHPARYTSEFLTRSDCFTVSVYPEQYRRALGYFGSHSGRDGDKAKAAGLTPVAFGGSVTYEEAELTFLCKTLYRHLFSKDDLAPEIQAMYAARPEAYPDFHGGWQPHLMFIGEILDVQDKRNK